MRGMTLIGLVLLLATGLAAGQIVDCPDPVGATAIIWKTASLDAARNGEQFEIVQPFTRDAAMVPVLMASAGNDGVVHFSPVSQHVCNSKRDCKKQIDRQCKLIHGELFGVQEETVVLDEESCRGDCRGGMTSVTYPCPLGGDDERPDGDGDYEPVLFVIDGPDCIPHRGIVPLRCLILDDGSPLGILVAEPARDDTDAP